MKKDYYKILGVNKDSSQDEIKKAFRKLSLKYHPDRNPGDKKAEEKFKEAAEAYEVLGNPDKKAEYDNPASQFDFRQSGGPDFGGMNIDDKFSQRLKAKFPIRVILEFDGMDTDAKFRQE